MADKKFLMVECNGYISFEIDANEAESFNQQEDATPDEDSALVYKVGKMVEDAMPKGYVMTELRDWAIQDHPGIRCGCAVRDWGQVELSKHEPGCPIREYVDSLPKSKEGTA